MLWKCSDMQLPSRFGLLLKPSASHKRAWQGLLSLFYLSKPQSWNMEPHPNALAQKWLAILQYILHEPECLEVCLVLICQFTRRLPTWVSQPQLAQPPPSVRRTYVIGVALLVFQSSMVSLVNIYFLIMTLVVGFTLTACICSRQPFLSLRFSLLSQASCIPSNSNIKL